MKWKSQSGLPENLLSTANQADSDAESREDRASLVRQSMHRLSASAREIVVLRYFSGLTHEQIGRVLGISDRAVHSRLCRARHKMADFLRHQGVGRREP